MTTNKFLYKSCKSKECIICQYWYFLEKGFKFQPDICNGCNDVLMMSVNLSHITILNIHGADYCCIINGISKSDAINLCHKNYFVISKLKNKFYSSQSPIFLRDVVVYNVLLFNKISIGEKNYKYLVVCISACCLFV